MTREISAVIVARGGSVRVPRKNLIELNGESLIARKIKQLQSSKMINRVIFGSDSDELLAIADETGAECIKRPDYFCDENRASANDMIGNMLSFFSTDIVVWAHCTNPLITQDTYDSAINCFLRNYPKFDSLCSVVELKEHLWSEKREPLNYNPWGIRHIPARDLPPLYMQDGGIFIQPYEEMKNNSYFFGKRPYLYVIPKEEFLDINEYRDVLLAKALIEGNNIYE